MHWAVAWTHADTIDMAFRFVCYLVVSAVPTVYALRANLRDPLARGVLIGTSAPAVAVLAAMVSIASVHMGWDPNPEFWHWLTRGIFTMLGLGEFMLLLELLRVLRDKHPYGDD